MTTDEVVKVFVDSDWAGDPDDARSTSGVRISYRNCKVMASSLTQHGVPALSSAEAELRAMSRGYCDGKFVQLLLQELGVSARLELWGDSSAALSNAAKLGPGKLRHVVTSALLIKTAVRHKDVVLRKVPSELNLADMHTKYHGPARHLELCGLLSLRTAADYTEAIDGAKKVELKKLNVLRDIGPVAKLSMLGVYESSGRGGVFLHFYKKRAMASVFVALLANSVAGADTEPLVIAFPEQRSGWMFSDRSGAVISHQMFWFGVASVLLFQMILGSFFVFFYYIGQLCMRRASSRRPEQRPEPLTEQKSVEVERRCFPQYVYLTEFGECWHADKLCKAIIDRPKTIRRRCSLCAKASEVRMPKSDEVDEPITSRGSARKTS